MSKDKDSTLIKALKALIKKEYGISFPKNMIKGKKSNEPKDNSNNTE